MPQKLPRPLAMPVLSAALGLALALPMLSGCSTAPGQPGVHEKRDRDSMSRTTGTRIHNVDRKGDVRSSSMVLVVEGPSARCVLDPDRC